MKELKISYGDLKTYCEELVDKIGAENLKKYKSIYPVPRGGYSIAIIMSRLTGIPIVIDHIDSRTLIVDDVCNTGNTLSKIVYTSEFKCDVAVLFLQGDNQQMYNPTYSASKVDKDTWVYFPDEKNNKEGVEDNIMRIYEYLGLVGLDANKFKESIKSTVKAIDCIKKEGF